jgi:hypothetical protein
MSRWRRLGFATGGLLSACGIAWIAAGGGPVLLILGVIAAISAAFEPIYGRALARPVAGDWHPTDEKFVDPESGRLVTVWFDPRTGERRYVDDEAQPS